MDLDALNTERFGRDLRTFDEVGSTNTVAAEWAREGAREGSVVFAEYQSSGRGRHGRTWDAHAGQNLTFSVVLRPSLSPDRLGRITLAAGVAVAEAVEAFVTPHTASIKWPNDVLLDGRKTCGMLLEASFGKHRDADTGAPDAVILGIGLNVNQADFPDAIADRATSLRLVAGRPIPRETLFGRVLNRLERRYDSLFADDGESVRHAYIQRLYQRGETTTLRFTGTDRTVSGRVCGITKDGALQLNTGTAPRGTPDTTLYAGEVTTQPDEE